MTAAPLLQIEGLSVEYFHRRGVTQAVQNVSLAIASGETVGLVGESGSGKSTVALAILRLIRASEGRITAGRILFEGQDLLALSEPAMRGLRGRDIAMVFQDPFTALNPVLTIHRQLFETLEAHGTAVQDAALENALAEVQLEPRRVLDAYPHQLSGGQRQRILIASALLNRPKLLLADEPTTALDVLVQKEILDLLFRLQKERGLAILLVSHNLAVIAQYAQRIAVMRAGAVVETADTRRFLNAPETAYGRQLLDAVPRLRTSPESPQKEK